MTNFPYSDDFGRVMEVGTRVRYVPGHAHGDLNHPDCELGVVQSWNSHGVWVLYLGDRHAKMTSPCDLTVQIESSELGKKPEQP